ncbi:hypothetical protein EDD11_006682 [Mortierella claussenii]|nr:hypothetical protein EDD11_006682 [Mortierella claussenii]
MYSTSQSDNTSGVLRSPSVSSLSGSGSHVDGGSASTSASSATTTTLTTPTGGGGMSSAASEVKLKRFLEHNQRLKEQLDMRHIAVSEASQSLIKFVTSTKDSFLPHLWGSAPSDPFSKQSTGCCTMF